MKSWTRTLNMDDAHTLLALARPGMHLDAWATKCHAALPSLSMPRRRELIRILRDGFLLPDGEVIPDGPFLTAYATAPAMAQIDLVHLQWALSHPLTLVAVEKLVAPALLSGRPDIPHDEFEDLVSRRLETSSAESLRKTRTVLLAAMEDIGVIEARGAGAHRLLRACRGRPHPIAFAYLVRRDLHERNLDGMIEREVTETSLAPRVTQCGPTWARHCLHEALQEGALRRRDDEIVLP